MGGMRSSWLRQRHLRTRSRPASRPPTWPPYSAQESSASEPCGWAHITIQVAVHWGCEVYVFTRSEAHCALARQLGAHWAGRVEDEPPGLLDSAVIFAPVGRLVQQAL